MRRSPKPTSVFRDYARIRRQQAAAAATHGVYCLKRDGQPYARPTVTERGQEAAEAAAERLMRDNPGSTYVVKPLRAEGG